MLFFLSLSLSLANSLGNYGLKYEQGDAFSWFALLVRDNT